MLLQHINPYGACDVPLLRRVLGAGEQFECTEEQARVLLAQVGNYEPADDEAKAIRAELDAEAEAVADGEDEVAGATEPAEPANQPKKPRARRAAANATPED